MSNQQKRIRQAVAMTRERLGDTIICKRCGATCETMAGLCNVDLDVECEGFRTYDAARTQALHDVGFFGRSR